MKYEEILENQNMLSTDAVKIFWDRFNELGIEIPKSRNTQFRLENVMSMVLEMSTDAKFATSATKELKRQAVNYKKTTGKKTRVPLAGWGRAKLVNLDPTDADRWCNRTMKSMSNMALKSNMISRTTMVGIDLTLVEYYGVKLLEHMLKTKAQNGTSYFDAHMTAHTIGDGFEIPVSDTRMTKNDKVDIILSKNIKKIQRSGIKPSIYLVDRGFFSVVCIMVLMAAGRYIIPAVKNARVIKQIEKHHRGEIEAATRFTMSNKEFGSVSFNLLIVKKDKHDKDAPIADRYVAFATNLPCRTKKELIETIPETYRMRWIEETAFRVIKDVMGKTCSNALHYRNLLYHFALLWYALWKCTKYADMLHEFIAGGSNFTMREFMRLVRTQLE